MKLAVIGSRILKIDDLSGYIPKDVNEIVSGGARGIDLCAAKFAGKEKIKLTEFFPEYKKYGRNTPLRRNLQIIKYADEVLAFWDGTSHGTLHVIEACKESGKKVTVIKL